MVKKTLSLYLVKGDIDTFEDALTEEARLKTGYRSTQIVERPEFGDGARLYVFVAGEYAPCWLTEIRLHFQVSGRIETNSAAAVLFFRSAGRIFASPFAHGWVYLDERRLEGDFGLRAAINALDDTKLKRLERANLGDAMRGVAQSPFQRGLTSFGLDDALDLIRKISGQTREDSNSDSLTGARSLRVTGEHGIGDLPGVAAEALAYYESRAYRNTEFAILDSVFPIADRQLSSQLDDLAAASIRDGLGQFELGLPVHLSDQAVSYRFLGPGQRGSHPDLLLRHYVRALGERLKHVTADTLRDHKISAKFEDDNRPEAKWSIQSALVGSLVHENERYAINEGEWYRIEQAFKDAIEAGYDELVENWEVAPEPLAKIYTDQRYHYEAEARYNARFAAERGYVLLDRAMIQIPGVDRSGFESCDILDIAGKRFMHIKKSSRRSSVLSHFFKQGANSARHFSMFDAAWTELYGLVESRAGREEASRLAIVRADARPWKIEYIIADTPRANGTFNIPFFSKVTLRDEVRAMRAMKYRAGLRFIPLQADQ